MFKKIKKLAIILLLCSSIFPLTTTLSTASSFINLDNNKIVIGAGVRMRSSPDLKADVLTKLTLGSIVHTNKRTKEKQRIGQNANYWYYLDAEKGWVFGHLLRDIESENQEETHLQLVQERIAKKKASFKDYVELYEYIKRILPEIKTVEIQAELKWQKLIALQQAANKIPFNQANKAPYATFVKQNEQRKILFYGESQGIYLVSSDLYWELAKQYVDLKIADKIAWFAANAPQGGECEGEASCMFGRMMGNEGQYIQRHPKGQFIENALKQVIEVVGYIIKNPENSHNSQGKIDQEIADSLKKEMKILKMNLKKVDVSSKGYQKLQTQLDTLSRMIQ